jgi:hypothetical protein
MRFEPCIRRQPKNTFDGTTYKNLELSQSDHMWCNSACGWQHSRLNASELISARARLTREKGSKAREILKGTAIKLSAKKM